MLDPQQLDSRATERIRQLAQEFHEGRRLSNSDIFVRDGVVEKLSAPSLYLAGWSAGKILPKLPFYPNIYLAICPNCVTKQGFEEFSALVKSRLVTPVLIAPYKAYPSEVAEFLIKNDHICGPEFSFYRYVVLQRKLSVYTCQSCARKRVDSVLAACKGIRGARDYRREVGYVAQNLDLFITPDLALFDGMEEAIRRRDLDSLIFYRNLSFALSSLRCAQSLDADVHIGANELGELSKVASEEFGYDAAVSEELDSILWEGLNLEIPAGIPISQYISFCKEVHWELNSVVKHVQEGAGNGREPIESAFSLISRINADLERLSSSPRFKLYKLAMSFAKRNAAVLSYGLLAAGLGIGITGSLAGCSAAAGAGIAVKVAKRKGIDLAPEEARAFVASLEAKTRGVRHRLLGRYAGVLPVSVAVAELREEGSIRAGR